MEKHVKDVLNALDEDCTGAYGFGLGDTCSGYFRLSNATIKKYNLTPEQLEDGLKQLQLLGIVGSRTDGIETHYMINYQKWK